ncbi:MAG: polyhydroxyalkanoate synthesis repressor PhaR [Proteobacteria bacterium]|nr:polyhydroxyalkanoate synthesis repressor PhaR [Pseudomonadota bacterium]MDA1331976.1 polyhydroxyalkanoate synthesis repressor PhaR [Pseudomonadota bacterium]
MVSEKRLIKKYLNRRLYDTSTSSYITLSDVRKLVMESCSFKVVDAKSGDDLTRSILLQIITEEESNGPPIFSSALLYQIIQFYGNDFQQMMSCYLEKNIQTFMEIQKTLQNPTQGSNVNNVEPMIDPNSYTRFISMQGPAIQELMTNYLEQNAKNFISIQQQMQQQANTTFRDLPHPKNMSSSEDRNSE